VTQQGGPRVTQLACQVCEGTGVVWATVGDDEIEFVCPQCAGNGVPFPREEKP
jgi:DnaJ-class molecular chaperone